MRKLRRSGILIYGVGINDADYCIEYLDEITNKRKKCIFYKKWVGMLERCYSDKLKIKHPTYKDCSVVPEWLSFMNFRRWMEKQDWKGKQLDKDLLFEGNKLYGPDNCVFVDRKVNTFVLDCGAVKGDYPTGVSFHQHTGKYQAQCHQSDKSKYLGVFDTPDEAHSVWREAKHKQATILAGQQTDKRVADALIKRYCKGVIK